MSATQDYCIVCGCDGPLERKLQETEFVVRGETLCFEVPVIECPSCHSVEAADGIDPAVLAFAKYRAREGLLTPEQISDLRKQYRLSQKSFATLLGMSEATINRYEGGGLQDRAHDEAIRACENPAIMKDVLTRRGDQLSPRQRQKVESALAGIPVPPNKDIPPGSRRAAARDRTRQTGFREYDYLRYAAVVVWYCQHMRLVTATSSNKLLFYSDFLHFKSEATSLTGSRYRRIQHGPVPMEYGKNQDAMEMGGFVVLKEARYANGNSGIELCSGRNAAELAGVLSSRELAVLQRVADEFKNMTPTEISDRSHQETAWKKTADRELIDYLLADDLSLSLPKRAAR